MAVLKFDGLWKQIPSGQDHRIFQIDEQGTLAQILIVDHASDTLFGPHYHRKTTELYRVVEGHVVVTHCAVDGLGECNGEIQKAWCSKGQTFTIDPWTAHQFEGWPGTVLVYIPLPGLPDPRKDTYSAQWLQEATARSFSDPHVKEHE